MKTSKNIKAIASIGILLMPVFLVNCVKEEEEPAIVFEDVILNTYNVGISDALHVYNDWSFLKPEISTSDKSIIAHISYGNQYKDYITFTIKGNSGVLNVTTQRQEITYTYETYTKTFTFHADDFDYYGHRFTVVQDGIFQDGELVQSLANFQLTETLSTLIDTEAKDVQTSFTGETRQANSESFTIGKGNEEYKLTYLSPTEIELTQTLPIQREIGTIRRTDK